MRDSKLKKIRNTTIPAMSARRICGTSPFPNMKLPLLVFRGASITIYKL
jgi:hypothetical protein